MTDDFTHQQEAAVQPTAPLQATGTGPDVQPLFDAAHTIAASAPYLALAILAIGLITGIVHLRRLLRAREALTDRVTVELIPTSTFAPGDQEVGRAAHHLTRIRYAASDIAPRGAAARLRYTAAPDGRMHCYLEGPAQAAAVVRMPAFSEVEIRATGAEQTISPVQFARPAQEDAQ